MDHRTDNAGNRGRGPVLLMATRAGRPEHTPEAEPVLIELQGNAVTITLDDGEALTLDAAELLAAVAGSARGRLMSDLLSLEAEAA